MKVLFFGRLADMAGRMRSAPDDIRTLGALRAFLTEGDPLLAEALAAKGVRVAINKAVISGDASLKPGDEVAFMPPLSGG